MSLNLPITAWASQRVWIVGASSGIGLALAEALLNRGARVAVSARKTAPLAELASRHPDTALAVPMDITRAEDWPEAHGRIIDAWQGIDIMVFCAAAYHPVRAWEIDTDLASRMIDTNLTSALRGIATVLPGMLGKGQGHISLIASVAGYMGLPKSLVYGPTKAALINLAESLYLDVHDKGIGVSIINPGFVDTPLTKGNDFKMPALTSPAVAAEEIIKGLEHGQFEIHFPKRFTCWLRMIRRLPYPVKFRLLKEVAKKS